MCYICIHVHVHIYIHIYIYIYVYRRFRGASPACPTPVTGRSKSLIPKAGSLRVGPACGCCLPCRGRRRRRSACVKVIGSVLYMWVLRLFYRFRAVDVGFKALS